MTILDIIKGQEPKFDAIAALVAERFKVPIALVNVGHADDIWVKGRHGSDVIHAPRSISFCTHVLDSREPLIVQDLAADERFARNPFVIDGARVRFYAGVPLTDTAGGVYGTLCILDHSPRSFGPKDLEVLRLYAEQVQNRIELSRLRIAERTSAIINDATSDGFVVCDARGVIVHWNPGAERLMGWTRAEAMGSSVSILLPEEDRAMRMENLATRIADPSTWAASPIEIRVQHRDGRKVEAECTLGISGSDGVVHMVAIIRDTSMRQRLLAEREASHAMLNSIIDNMPAAIFAKDPTTHRYVFVNSEFEKMTGLPRQSIVGRTTPEIGITPRRKGAEIDVRRMQDGVRIDADQILHRQDGEERSLRTRKLKSSGMDGQPLLLGFSQDVTEERAANERLAYLAHHDPLTGCLNRTRFLEMLNRAVEDNQRDVAVICLDLDRFKVVNDLYGHAAGDEVLLETSSRLMVASGGLVARLGGDEFALMVEDAEDAPRIARRCVDALATSFGIRDRGVGIGGSAGVAYRRVGEDLDADLLMRNADLALYRAKNEGRNRACFFEPEMDDAARERRKVEADLRQALIHGDIHVEYQPLADAHTGKVMSFEALARWDHARLGRIPPSLFIPIAEESGMMVELGRHVLRTAVREAATWDPSIKVAVNLSPAQMEDDGLCEEIASILDEAGLDGSRLEIEITEGMLVRNTAHAVRLLKQLRSMGILIGMDDFGTGYSSLSYFRTFPFDKVKIDQSFIRDMDTNPQSMAIVQAVIQLGRGLGMPVVAEGVETEEQLATLKVQGCDIVQGYHIGRPEAIERYKDGSVLQRDEPDALRA